MFGREAITSRPLLRRALSRRRILVVDIGGSFVKLLMSRSGSNANLPPARE